MRFLPLSSLRKAPLGESGIRPHLLLGLGKSLSVLRVCSLKRQYLRRDSRRVCVWTLLSQLTALKPAGDTLDMLPDRGGKDQVPTLMSHL